MDEYTNGTELVIRKKKYAYIFLIILLISSIIISNFYFTSLKASEINDSVSGENFIEDSNNDLVEKNDLNISDNVYENEIKNNDEKIENNDYTFVEKVDEKIEEKANERIEEKVEQVEDKNDNSNVEYFTSTREIDPAKPMVALTFDDGPDPKRTVKLLEILKKYNVVATFFDIGNMMEKYPEVVKQEVEAGCDVGGHTYSHVNLNSLSKEEVKREIEKVEQAFKNATGQELKYIRPTYGNANSTVRPLIDRPIINWDVDSLDWQSRDADKVIEEIRKTKNLDGRIILMHVIYDSTLEAVSRLIPKLIEEGYQIVTISEMAEYKGFTLQEGKIYYEFIK